jgi:hypothetical protein
MGPAEPAIAVGPAQSRLGEGPYAPTRWAPAVSARSRCSRMLWDVIVRLGALASGTTVLAGLSINESIEIHVLSAVVFAVVPAAAALVLGATLVCLVRLLGLVYDLLRTRLLPGFWFCLCAGTAFLTARAREHKVDIYRALRRGAMSPLRFTKGCVVWLEQIRGKATAGARNGLARLRREAVLEAFWIKRSARSLLAATSFVAGWPIRRAARLILRLTGAPTRLRPYSPACMARP